MRVPSWTVRLPLTEVTFPNVTEFGLVEIPPNVWRLNALSSSARNCSLARSCTEKFFWSEIFSLRPQKPRICDTLGAAVPNVYGAGCWMYCRFKYRLLVVATCTTE